MFASLIAFNLSTLCVALGQRSRLVGAKTTPVVSGPSSDDFITTRESRRFPEMPALPPLVSKNNSVLRTMYTAEH